MLCLYNYGKLTLATTEGAIKNGQSRETGNVGYTRRRTTKQKHNTRRVGTPLNTNSISKTWALRQT